MRTLMTITPPPNNTLNTIGQPFTSLPPLHIVVDTYGDEYLCSQGSPGPHCLYILREQCRWRSGSTNSNPNYHFRAYVSGLSNLELYLGNPFLEDPYVHYNFIYLNPWNWFNSLKYILSSKEILWYPVFPPEEASAENYEHWITMLMMIHPLTEFPFTSYTHWIANHAIY